MQLSTTILIAIVIVIASDIKPKKENLKKNKAIMITASIVCFLMIISSAYNYFNSAVNLDEFNLAENIYSENGISIYTAIEAGEEKYIIFKTNKKFNVSFLHCKSSTQGITETYIDTLKYKHHVIIENSVVYHTLKKNWIDGLISFWAILALGIYQGLRNKKLSKADKIVGIFWLIICIGMTIYFVY